MKTATETVSPRRGCAGAPSARMAAWHPTTLLDWPGRVATTVFLAGCNLRCPYCHNGELLGASAPTADWRELREYLRVRCNWIDGVVITGGEPTFDPGLPTLLEAIAFEGIPVKLDTNGTNPGVLRTLLGQRLIEYVALDVKTTFDRYDEVVGLDGAGALVKSSIEVLLTGDVDHEFRTTAYPAAVSKENLPRIARALRGGQRFAIQQYRAERTLDPSAAAVQPYHAHALQDAAVLCSEFLPTTTRGV